MKGIPYGHITLHAPDETMWGSLFYRGVSSLYGPVFKHTKEMLLKQRWRVAFVHIETSVPLCEKIFKGQLLTDLEISELKRRQGRETTNEIDIDASTLKSADDLYERLWRNIYLLKESRVLKQAAIEDIKAYFRRADFRDASNKAKKKLVVCIRQYEHNYGKDPYLYIEGNELNQHSLVVIRNAARLFKLDRYEGVVTFLITEAMNNVNGLKVVFADEANRLAKAVRCHSSFTFTPEREKFKSFSHIEAQAQLRGPALCSTGHIE